MISILQSRYSHSLEILTGLLIEEVKRDPEVRRRKLKPKAAWFLGTE